MTKSSHLLPILAAAGVALLCSAGIAVYLGWLPASVGPERSVLSATARQAPTAPLCGRCGVIEAVRDTHSGVASRGTLTGAPLGQQLVGFSKDLTNMVGLLLVAMAGAPPEGGPATRREIAVRFEDGSTRILVENDPSWKPGDRVKVVNGRIRPISTALAAALERP